MSIMTAVWDRVLEPVITPDLARQLLAYRADDETQTRIDELAEKCNEGRLSTDERKEYETFVSAINVIAIFQAKARRVLKNEGL